MLYHLLKHFGDQRRAESQTSMPQRARDTTLMSYSICLDAGCSLLLNHPEPLPIQRLTEINLREESCFSMDANGLMNLCMTYVGAQARCTPCATKKMWQGGKLCGKLLVPLFISFWCLSCRCVLFHIVFFSERVGL